MKAKKHTDVAYAIYAAGEEGALYEAPLWLLYGKGKGDESIQTYPLRLGGRAYELCLFCPADGTGDEEEAIHLLFHLLQEEGGPFYTGPIEPIWKEMLHLLHARVPLSAEPPHFSRDMVCLNREALFFLLGMILPAIMAGGQGRVTYETGEFTGRILFSGGRGIQQAFWRELATEIAGRARFSLTFTADGLAITFPICKATSYHLYAKDKEPAKEDPSLRYGYLLRVAL